VKILRHRELKDFVMGFRTLPQNVALCHIEWFKQKELEKAVAVKFTCPVHVKDGS
jgi:hypothetical protein